MQLRLLRLFLGFSAFSWGVSAMGVFASWQQAEKFLEGLGAKPIVYDPMLDYWLRMAAGAFALIGLWYLVLLVHGLRLSLPAFPFYGDVSACLIAGSGILFCSRSLRSPH
jgi:hypothetical protein